MQAIGLVQECSYYEYVYFHDPDDPTRLATVWHDDDWVSWEDLQMSLGFTNIDIDAFAAAIDAITGSS